MSDDGQRWKAKYLENLEQQEKLERRWDARLDLLRRGLVRSSLAAEGADKAVDQCMQEMREILRRDEIDAGLSALIPRLEKAVLDSEQRRQERAAQIVSALSSLAGQLQALPLPREVRKPLKGFTKRLESRAGQIRELPALLAELSQLQRQALALLEREEVERPGLLQRLFGGRERTSDESDEASAITPPTPAAQVVSTQPESQPDGAETPAAVAPVEALRPPPAEPVETLPPPRTPLLDSLPLSASLLTESTSSAAESPAPLPEPADAEYALPPSPEPGYSAIAEHVEATLLGLLDELSLPERHQAQAEGLRERIRHGLNWYELVPVLDDVSVLMLAVAGGSQQEFERYLKQLNERLSAFQEGLQFAREGYSDSLEAARELDSELREQMDDLHSSVRDAVDLESLKRAVESRLDGLLGSMDRYQRLRDEREQTIADRLQHLVERVASMEQEAKGFREHLEEQRQRALVDPLTGLPNRAALDERLELEVARWQRYGGDLLLAVLDVDHFKRINDNYGHLAGDKVLKIIAGELTKRLRKTDFIARFGGEEFVLLVPSTPLEGGQQLLETLRAAIEACPFHFRGERLTITLSAGLAAFADGERSERTFERADQALYRAKRGGRNRIETA
ncbi:GGDEF domain-containing protein [Pseudomonas sp. PIC25]|uniref:diguanylate cyclase n=1 Tax=Pseudomonas sp. PIC25 TaxID=1958773 RepID=UPI000BAB512F|nr:diguanylate cyclase [Pseudomonas sp. PIC25]PAU64926.1 GGDEF domain-containing protein [Pseudomonas sp. PIC25]